MSRPPRTSSSNRRGVSYAHPTNTIKSDIDVEALCDELFKLYQDGKKLPQVAEFIDTVTAAAALLKKPQWNMKNLKKIIKLTIEKQAQLGH